MSIHPQLAICFNFEDQKRGQDLVTAQAVVVSSASDTNVNAFVKGSGSPRVRLQTENIVSPLFTAHCTCSAAAKGRACKHIWSVLLKLEDHDFLETKTQIEVTAKPANSELKQRQSDYRKVQYQKQKLRAKNRDASAAPVLPPELLKTKLFFEQNGFTLAQLSSEDALNQAKKILLRVFHPDRGGTHEEVLLLNQHLETMREYLAER